jgi:transketolase
MRRQFGKTIVELAEKDPRVVVLYGDVFQNMEAFQQKFPNRIFNVGICEQSMVSMAAGMALEGLRPIVYSLTPFIFERALEQWKMDVDVHNAPVIGVGYSSYPTHGPSQSPLNNSPNWLHSAKFNHIYTCIPHTSEYFDESLRWAHEKGCPAMFAITRDNNVG